MTAENTLHIYTLVSTEIQATEGTSLDSQEELGIEKAAEFGFDHVVWSEGGASSNYENLDNRPVLMSLLREVEEGKVKHLYVWNNDRLSRNEITAQTIRVALQRNDVVLYTKDGKYDLTNPTDKLVKTILDGIAQYDNALRTERTRLGKLNRVKNGFWQGGPPPFGYQLMDGRLVVQEEEAKWVFKIFDAYASGSPLVQIKALLDTNGVKTRRGKGTWSLGSINALLQNSHYKGSYIYEDAKSGEKVEVACPAILADTLWHSAQAHRKKTLKRKGQINRTKRFYLLRDLMQCGHCGKPMGARTKPDKAERFYYCPNKERSWVTEGRGDAEKWKRGTGCGMDRSLNIPQTDQIVWDALKTVVKNSVILKERVKREVLEQKARAEDMPSGDISKLDANQRRLERDIQNAEQSIGKVEANFLLGKTSEGIYQSTLQNLQTELDGLKAQLSQVELQKQEARSNKRWWDWVAKYEEDYLNLDNFEGPQRKEYIETLVEKIVVRYDQETKRHSIELDFGMPFVSDQLIYNDPVKKSQGYRVREGDKTLYLSERLNKDSGQAKKRKGE